jgi:signal transduction histidine kinase
VSAVGSRLGNEVTGGAPADARSPMAYLLHALNQPLTGLQCSLELSLLGPRTPEQYIGAMRDGLELTARMRVLVEAIRELADAEQSDLTETEVVSLHDLLEQTTNELRPIAEAKNASISFYSNAPLSVRAERDRLATLVFRFVDAALSSTAWGSALRLTAASDRGHVCISASWLDGTESPEHSPFSRQELGLLIAQAGWKRAGAEWASERSGNTQTIKIRLPLVTSSRELHANDLQTR